VQVVGFGWQNPAHSLAASTSLPTVLEENEYLKMANLNIFK